MKLRLRRGESTSDVAFDPAWTVPAWLAASVSPIATRLGVTDSPFEAEVDGRGAVSTELCTVDWVVGADDRWYVPAREGGLGQVRIDHAPVVATSVRVSGGVVTHTAYAAKADRFPGGDEWLIVDIHNGSKVPVAAAWLFRPWVPGMVRTVSNFAVNPAAIDKPEGAWVVTADGQPVAVLARRPSRHAAGAGTDPLIEVLAGEADSSWVEPVTSISRAGEASLALLVPIPHDATTRLAIPRGATDRPGLAWPGSLPAPEAVARGWTARIAAGPRIEVPDPVLADAVAGARRSIYLAHKVASAKPSSTNRRSPTVHMVSRAGLARPGPTDPGTEMEILRALAWWGDTQGVGDALAQWTDGQVRGGHFGSIKATSAALGVLAAHAVSTGDPGAARTWLPEVGGALQWLGGKARRGSIEAGEGLAYGEILLQMLGQPEAAMAVAADAMSNRPEGGSSQSLRIWQTLRKASSTWTWSDPELWAGDDALVAGRLLNDVSGLLVRDRSDGVVLIPWMPPSWWGLSWELHGAPTRWGRLSYAVRWHGARPALLWELSEPVASVWKHVVLRAPGLDSFWTSSDRNGEALLSPVPQPDEAVTVTGASMSAAPPRSVWRAQDPGPDAPVQSPRSKMVGDLDATEASPGQGPQTDSDGSDRSFI